MNPVTLNFGVSLTDASQTVSYSINLTVERDLLTVDVLNQVVALLTKSVVETVQPQPAPPPSTTKTPITTE